MTEYIMQVDDDGIVYDEFREPVVRCRDCKRYERRKIDNVPVPLQWCTRYNYATYEGGYCAFGERREDG